MELLTAEQAVELSGFESELSMIDQEMRFSAAESRRFVYLNRDIRKSHLTDIYESLRERGFRITEEKNPYGIKVSW